MSKLILLRHFQSQWNFENRFTGWVDVPLLKDTDDKAKEVFQKISNFKIDKIYSSCLFRNKDTVAKILKEGDKYPIFIHLDKGKMKYLGGFKDEGEYMPVYVSESLNERHYGQWQGKNKEEIKKEYGEDNFKLLRRSFSARPPGGESLKDVFSRAVHFNKSYVERDLKDGKNILIVASHNYLRALVKYFEKISDDDIVNFEMEVGTALVYELNNSLGIEKKELL
jgi:2,3-bisphosphoglycerate-dependent phosphoglycerate mutase